LRKNPRPLVIASRRSVLARAQAEAVGQTLMRVHPGLRIEFRWIESEGDQRTDVPLAASGGKGLFARAIEIALLRREADLAVHSMKDLPAAGSATAKGLTIAAVPLREDVRDCLIARSGAATMAALPHAAILGTASPRRAAQVRRLRPDLQIQLIRGNVETRLRKVLIDQQFDATLLAMAGLRRGGFGDHAKHPVDPAILLPAACQGALALQCRTDDHVTLMRCLPLNDSITAQAVNAERRIVAGLHGDCDSPIAVLAEPIAPPDAPPDAPAKAFAETAASADGAAAPVPAPAAPGRPAAVWGFRLRARVIRPDGGACAEVDLQGPVRQTTRLVNQALALLRERGALAILGHA
jgi:hydroxymethylbilane synthase